MDMFTGGSTPKPFGRDDLCKAVCGAEPIDLPPYDQTLLDIPEEDLYDAACDFSAWERHSRTLGLFGRSPAAVADVAHYYDPVYADIETAYQNGDRAGVRKFVSDLVLNAIHV